jgi:hypothetical protein
MPGGVAQFTPGAAPGIVKMVQNGFMQIQQNGAAGVCKMAANGLAEKSAKGITKASLNGKALWAEVGSFRGKTRDKLNQMFSNL